MQEPFIEPTPTRESCWRAIVMMGRNVATYKFALAASLIELSSKGNDFIPLEDLAAPFSKNLCEHLKHSDKQITSPRSQFLDSCRKANDGEVSSQELIETTVRLGFVNVIDAFHVVNQGETPVRFFNDDRKTRSGITFTDDYFYLAEGGQFSNLPQEVEARWNLVETAWGLDMAPNLLDVEYDPEGGQLYVPRRDTSRTPVTSCRDALNGYQKGKCFYCFVDISIQPRNDDLAHVDHFLPHVLKSVRAIPHMDGVWNLVLACKDCNMNKSALVPQVKYLNRLNTRNNYLISSHHPLREILIRQTGNTDADRHSFLRQSRQVAEDTLIHTWGPAEEFGTAF
jgi:5-methylcytosine-specific restriction endonuclease McrA